MSDHATITPYPGMSPSNPRVLLRQLRELLAESGELTAQGRLDRTVELVASNMVTEVCSIYLLRADGRLELCATQGLKADAVHLTRLRIGQGLVGQIAANATPLNLQDAQSHPNFEYRPETGEEIYSSFLGVPILRAGRVTGVLAVQNKIDRIYHDDEVEALQTIAMVLAELIAASGMAFSDAIPDDALMRGASEKFDMTMLADGIGQGEAVLHEPRIEIHEIVADDPEVEEDRLEAAINDLRVSIDQLLSQGDMSVAGEHREVMETYRMFAHDRGWTRRLMEAVHSGLSAEAAVDKVQAETRARLQHQTDPYLRERLHDLDDLSNRLMRHLTGRHHSAAGGDLPENTILFARSMGPADLLDYDRTKLKGVVLAEGSPTAHVSIIARALDIPMLGRAPDVLDHVNPGDLVIIDGDHGQLFLRPSDDIIAAYGDSMAAREERAQAYLALKDAPALTKDGTRIQLNMNAGLLVDLPHLEETGADGIGLFRTELQFMVSSTLPRQEAQQKIYREAMDAAGDKPVIFRTLDVGGDKMLPYLSMVREENPALGWRAIRVALDRPALLRYQTRALLAAAEGRPLHLMFPMIADVSEFVKARAIVDREIERLKKLDRPRPTEVKVGTMIEVPSIAWQLGALLPKVDFISVGSNDLLQFFFASDRGNPKLADRYDLLSPSVLSFLNFLVSAAKSHDVPISLCGEVAGRPLEAMALIGIGFRSISMPAAAIGPVKLMLHSLNLPALESFLLNQLDSSEHSLRAALKTYARDHDILI